MSGILRKMSHKRLAAVLLLATAVSLAARLWTLSALALVLLALLIWNYAIAKKALAQKRPFDSRNSRVRNVKCLLLGDLFSPEKLAFPLPGDALRIRLPGCSLYEAYAVLAHSSSILEESHSDIYLFVDGRNENKKTLSPFAKAFLSEAFRRQRNIRDGNFFLLYPAQSIAFLLDIPKNGWRKTECPSEELQMFCKERNITLHYMIT